MEQATLLLEQQSFDSGGDDDVYNEIRLKAKFQETAPVKQAEPVEPVKIDESDEELIIMALVTELISIGLL